MTPDCARARLRRADDFPLWARFDAQWYARAYDVGTADAPALRRFYLAHGQALGHAPNPLFDETWYLWRYKDTAEMVAAGGVDSGFDSFCRGGWSDRSPHWLFDRDRARQSDDVYDAFLRSGGSAHRLFDADYYLAALDPATRAHADAVGAYAHYLRRIGLETPEPRSSPFFDPAWYQRAYPGVADAIGRGEWRCALHHYLANTTPMAFDPLPQFSEAFYFAHNPDIRAEVEAGNRRNGFTHFLDDGMAEMRAPTAEIDLAYYRDLHPSLPCDGASVFLHCVAHGSDRPTSPSSLAELPPEHAAKALWRARADALLPLHARRTLDFSCAGEPVLSVVMVLHDQFALTMRTLISLRENDAREIELILVDSGSADETRHISRYVAGARLLRLDVNVGFVRACNAALPSVTAPLVLYLNNDIELGPGAILAAIRRMDDATIGAVGGKIIRAHGRLQEAGCIVWHDGVTEGYLRDASPLAPEANFVHDVDFVSGAFLMVRAALLERLDGFDDDYAPAYYEDADLCLRIAKLGFRVVYDPAVVVHHLEYGSAAHHTDSQARMTSARATFASKHPEIRRRPEASDAARVAARRAGPRRTRILMIEDMLPLRRIGSGFVRSNDIVRVMAGLGFEVTLFPVLGNEFNLAAVFADLPDTTEAMHDQSLATLSGFLDGRLGHYDVVWIARTHNLDRTIDVLRPWAAACPRPPRFVLDTEAVASTRAAARAALDGVRFDLDTALAGEFAHAAFCDDIVAVNDADAATIGGLGFARVATLGHMRPLALTSRGWGERAGLLFVGSIHGLDSPNYDSLCWFVDDVLPLVERALGWETRLTVIGHLAEGVSLDRFARHARVTLRGEVVDTRAEYDRHRVFVAPTRYAGGAPYKVHEAASFGVPVVATELIRAQLAWDGALLSADAGDPAGFAEAVLRLYRDEALWHDIRAQAAARIARENSPERYATTVRALVEGAPVAGGIVPFKPRPGSPTDVLRECL